MLYSRSGPCIVSRNDVHLGDMNSIPAEKTPENTTAPPADSHVLPGGTAAVSVADPDARQSSPVQAPTAPVPARPGRRWGRRLLLAFVLLLIVAAFLPQIVALPVFRPWLLRAALPNFPGTVTIEELSLAWWRPIHAAGIEVRPSDKPTSVQIASIDLDRPLWELLSRPGDVGTIHVHRPAISIDLSAVRGASAAPADPAAPPSPTPPKNLSLAVHITDASLTVHDSSAKSGPDSPQAWGVRGIDIDATLVPASDTASGLPELQTGRLLLLDHQALTVEMCNDVLKYIAPILARATLPSGDVSLEVDHVRWPLGHPELADVTGRLSLHAVRIAPGPAVASVLKSIPLLNFPDSIVLAKEDVVEFQMREGRVHHQGLAFGLPERGEHLLVRTHGSVGVPDQTLDITADVPLPTELLRDPEKVATATPARIQLHVGGTLNDPQIERLPGDQPLLEGVLGAAGQWLKNRRERKATEAAEAEASGIEPEAAAGNGRRPFGGLLGGRRRRRQAEAAGSSATLASPGATLPGATGPGEPTLAEPLPAESLRGEPPNEPPAATREATDPEAVPPGESATEASHVKPANSAEPLPPGQSAPEQSSADQSSATTPPRRRPLRRLIERLLTAPAEDAPTSGS
jgi:hypothetical protein